MSKWVTKVWGKTRELIDCQFYSKHELQLRAGHHCSLHFHRHRANKFHVTSGEVEIIEFYGPKVERTTLRGDNVHSVPSLVPHLFVVHDGGTMFEEYYSDRGGPVQRDDIVRLVLGGKVNSFSTLVQDLLKEYHGQ